MQAQIPLAHLDHYYDLAVRKSARAPVAVSATPSTRGIDVTHAMAKAEEVEKARQFSAGLDLKEKRSAEVSRQHDIGMEFERNQLDKARNQNTVANIISAGNLGLAAATAYANLKEVKKRELRDKELIAALKGIPEMRQRQFNKINETIQKLISTYKT